MPGRHTPCEMSSKGVFFFWTCWFSLVTEFVLTGTLSLRVAVMAEGAMMISGR